MSISLHRGTTVAGFVCILMSAPLGADEPRQLGPHEHGAARLEVVLDGHALVIALHSPAANVIGFEHRPRDDAEREAIATSLGRLRDGGELFELTAEAGCRLSSVDIDSPLSGHDGDHGQEASRAHNEEHAHEEDHGEKDEHVGQHADIDSTWTFQCESPGALGPIAVRLFERFDGFEAIDVQLVGPNGQSATRLTSTNAVISW